MYCEPLDDGTVNVSVTRGDTLRLRVDLTGTADAPVDVTGWSWLAQVRAAPDQMPLIVIDVLVVDAPTGVLELSIDDEVTAGMQPADYVWDLQATDQADDVRTVLDGGLRIRADVSVAP
jgi:hypothetical protein